MDRIKHTFVVFYSLLLVFFVTNTTLAQYKSYGENIVANGDFSSGGDNWVIEGGNGTVSHNDTLKFEGVTAGDPWALQSYQSFTAEQIAALATGGDWELTFDAMSPDGAKNFHVFLGQVGGAWDRYWASDGGNGPGDVAVDGDWKTYTLSTTIFETWDAMKLGFEVAADAASLHIDNIQMRKVSNNIVFNGDFSLGDSAWVFEGAADISVTDGELAFNNIPGTGNTYEVQAHQFFTSGTDGINNKDSIYVGPYQVSFDARSSAESHDLHLFLGEVGGGWARYLDEAGSGKITVDQEMKTYTVNFGVDQVWETMRIGFEVNYGAGDLFVDNVIFTRIYEIKPDAPQVALSSDDGIIKIDVIDNSSASYDVYFSTAPFSDPRDSKLLATLNSETGLSTTHTIKAPHHSMVKNYTAYVGVIAKSAKGSASEMSSASINTITSINENYIYQLNSDAVNTVSDALNEGTVPSGEALAAFFPSDYKPFTISSDAKVTVGDKPDDDNDLSGKFWIGYETTTGSDYLIIYSEIKDDLLVPGEWDGATGAPNSGGAWNYDSFEGGFSTYSITDPVAGSPNHQMGAGTSDYQYRIGVTDNADKSGYVPYAHAYNIGAVNGPVPNSATIAEVTDGMYRTLTLLSIRELSNLEPSNSHIAFPNADGVSAIPFQLSLNDNDIIGGGRETQNVWSNRSFDANWWQIPSQWEIVGLVGSNVEYNNSDQTGRVVEEPVINVSYNGIQKFQQFGKIIHSIFDNNIHRKIILDDEGSIKEQCNDPSLLWGSYDVLNMSDSINDYVYYVGKNGFYARQKISTNCDEVDIEVLQSPTQVDITDISYYQGKIVIASSEGKLYSTTSIDENWNELFSSSSFYPNSIEINEGRIFLLGQSGNLFYSDDGNDWFKSNTGTFNNLNSVDFANQNGFLVGDNGIILFSIDGGENWQYGLTNPVEVDFNDVSFFDDQVGYIAGEYGYLFRTDDGGITWARVRSGYGESYLQVVPMNPFVITYVGYSGNSGFILESYTEFFDDAIASINNQTWQGISTFHNIGLANTADWLTMSWGNFGARQMGNEPREPFPNSPDDSYYNYFQQSWDLLYNSINTGEKLLAHLDSDETTYPAEEVLDFKVKLNTLIGLSYGQLGLKFDNAFSQSLKTKSLRANNSLNTSNELYSYSTDIDNVDEEINEKVLLQFKIPELSHLKSKIVNSNQLLPYDEIINLSNTYLENAVNSYLYLESSQSNYQVTDLLQNTWNFDVFTRFVNTTSAAHLLYKARHSDDSIDLASIIDFTSNGLRDISIEVASDDGFNEWTHNAYVYSVYPGWGRVDQAVLNLIDPEYPSKHEGVDLPPLETSDQRFDEYFEYLNSNNFRPERGLYFFSNYRYKRIDPVIFNDFTGGYPFVNKFENDLIRAEAFYLSGKNSEAISLINSIRLNSGSNLLELSSNASNEEIEDALYYEWVVEIGPYSYGPTSWYTNRRYEKLQNGTITQLPIPALILEQNGMEIYTYGGILENTIEPMEVYYPTNSDLVSTSPTVEWEEIDAAASYRLEIELNGENVYDVNVTGNSHQVEIELNRNTQYRLIVNALDNSGTTIRSSNYISFRTVNNPFLAPLIIAPREGQEVSTSGIRLYWKDQCDIIIDESCWNSPGMASWVVQISNDSNFVSIDEEFFLTERPLSNTRFSLTDLTPPLQINGKTYLRMKISTPGGDSEWSNFRSVNLMGEPNINTMSLIVEGGYGKTNHTLSSRIFVDQLYEGAELYSFQFELSVSESFNFDSLHSSIDISDIVLNFDTETNVLKVAGASTQKIPHDKPIAELFYHFSEVGEHNLILTEGKLNSEPVSDRYSGSIFIDEFIPGDVDDNKVVDAFDAAVILHRVVEKELIPNDSVLWWDSDIWFNWRYNAADVSQDDNLNAFDASLILQKIVGLISDYPASVSENSGITLTIENSQILISTENEINAITLTLNKSEYFSLTEPDYLVSNVTGVWNETDEKYMFSMAAPAGINESILSFPYEINTSDSFILELKSETDNTIKEYSFEISNTGIVSEEYEKEQPIRYHLSQNYPNPFNPSTRIEYSLPETSIVRLEVYNSIGKKIMELVNGQKPAGNYTATFDASGLSSGVYLYKLTTPSFTQTKKMLLIK